MHDICKTWSIQLGGDHPFAHRCIRQCLNSIIPIMELHTNHSKRVGKKVHSRILLIKTFKSSSRNVCLCILFFFIKFFDLFGLGSSRINCMFIFRERERVFRCSFFFSCCFYLSWVFTVYIYSNFSNSVIISIIVS